MAHTGSAEFGNTALEVTGDSVLLRELPTTQQVWMSHNDEVTVVPDGFAPVASTAGAAVAAMEIDDEHANCEMTDYAIGIGV